jgi:hypothetical protein
MYVNAIKQMSQSRGIKVDVKRDINYAAEAQESKEKDELMRGMLSLRRAEQRARSSVRVRGCEGARGTLHGAVTNS